MAADVESLLHDVLVFLQRLQPQHLPVDALEIYKALLERLQRLDSRPSYLDMNGARTLHRMRLSDLPPATAAPDVDDAAPASYASPASPAIPVTTMKRLPSLPTLAASADNPEHQQEQYESMLSGQEEIYHDIAPPTTDGPSYANIPSLKSDSEMNKLSTEMDNLDIEARPLYDDVVVPPKAPEYCNLTQDTSSFVHDKDGEQGMADHLYDDIGPTESRASVYELIQDPMISQGIRCS